MDQATQETFREFLKNADRLIKERNFNEARAQLAQARKLDPKDPYIGALEARIIIFEKKPDPAKPVATVAPSVPKDEQQQAVTHDPVSTEHPKTDTESKKVLDQERSKFEELRNTLKQQYEHRIIDIQKKLEEEYQKKLKDELAKAEKRFGEKTHADEAEQKRKAVQHDAEAEHQSKLQSQNLKEQKISGQEVNASIELEKKRLQAEYDAMVVEQNENIKRIRAELQSEMEKMSKQYVQKMEFLGSTMPKTREEALQFYRNKMRESYINGEPSIDNAKSLMELNEMLGLTFDDHLAMETDIRLELYVSSVEKQILSGNISFSSKHKLDELKQRFHITPEEASQLEPYILSSFERLAFKGRILIADDDLPLLNVLEKTVSSDGYQVVACESVAQALEALKTTSVDLILSDIQFLNQAQDGFQFFAAVQRQPHLRKTPFVFLSSITDGVMIISGKKLGVDDYLTKPLDSDLLFAVIEGKLRRYRSLDRN